MKIKNLTRRPQTLHLRENNLYSLLVIPARDTRDVGNATVANLSELVSCGVISIESFDQVPPVIQESIEELTQETTDTEKESTEGAAPELSNNTTQDNGEDSTPKNSEFICDICGAEFASQRGLNSHKNKAHSEEQ